MADDLYSVGSGGSVTAGIVVPPSWLGAVGEWSTLPNSNWWSSGVPWSGTSPGSNSGGVSSVFKAWSGGVLNTVGIWRSGAFVPGTFQIVWGGGHGDWGGNEVYAYGPLESNAPAWSRVTDPTIPGPDDVARSGGYPVSRHTYDSLQYLPDSNQMLAFGAAGYYHTGFNFSVVDVFDFDVDPSSSNPWSTADSGFVSFGGGGIGSINMVSGYDPVNKKAWGLGQGNASKLQCWDAVAQSWSNWASDNPDGPSNSKAALDYANGLLVTRSNAGLVLVKNVSTPTATVYTPSVTGTPPASGNTTIEWDSAGGRHVLWASGKTLHFLTPGASPSPGGDAWAWSSTTPGTGATPGAAEGNGVYGRCRMATFPWGRGLVLFPAYNAAGAFYRMS